MNTTTVLTISVAFIAVGIFFGGWWIGDIYGYLRRKRDELENVIGDEDRPPSFTPKSTIQSWSREQLESAFAQREYQLVLTQAKLTRANLGVTIIDGGVDISGVSKPHSLRQDAHLSGGDHTERLDTDLDNFKAGNPQ